MSNRNDPVDSIARPDVGTKRVFRDLFGSLSARLIVLPVGGIATILGSRIVVQATGTEGFAWFSLLVSLPLLIPISDFGIGAALTDVVALDGITTTRFWMTFKKVMRMLLLICCVASALAGLFSALGLWSRILGLPASPSTEIVCGAISIFSALGIPLGAAQRILLSLGKQALSTVVLGLGGVWSLIATWLVALSGSTEFVAFAAAYASGPLAAQLLLAAVVGRRLYRLDRDDPSESQPTDSVGVRTVAVPMAIIGLALPLAYQSDRSLLAHVSTAEQLAAYSLVALLYTPLLSILSVGGQTLWPIFMSRRQAGRIRELYWRAFGIFSALGLVLAAGLVVLGPLVSRIVGKDAKGFSAPGSTYFLFSVLLLVFALHTANGMLLMDRRGRSIQAVGSIAMLIVKLPVAVLLGSQFGADGVIVSTLVAVTLCLVIPASLVVRRYLRSPGRHLVQTASG